MEVRPVWKGGQPNIKIYIKKWRSVPFFILISIFYYMFFFFSKTSIYTFIFFTQYAEYIIFIAALYIPIKTADFITLMNYTIKKGIYAHIFCRSYNNKTKRRKKKKKKVFLCRTKSHSQTRRNYISTRSGKRSGTSGVWKGRRWKGLVKRKKEKERKKSVYKKLRSQRWRSLKGKLRTWRKVCNYG